MSDCRCGTAVGCIFKKNPGFPRNSVTSLYCRTGSFVPEKQEVQLPRGLIHIGYLSELRSFFIFLFITVRYLGIIPSSIGLSIL